MEKTLNKVMIRAGFVDSGYRNWEGVYRGKLMEVIIYRTI
jgi:hypothetical protein